MPSTPDRPDGSDDPFEVAETAQVAARETGPAGDRADGAERPTEAMGPSDRPTVAVGASRRDRDTVLVDDRMLGSRETVRLPRRSPGRVRRAPLPIATAFAALWAALLSYLPVAAVIGLARTLEGAGGLSGAARAGLAGWLLGHGVPIGTSIGSLGLAPLLLTMLIVWRLGAAGLHVTRAIGARHSGSTGNAVLVAFAIGLTYSLIGSIAALGVDGRGTEVAPGRAAVQFFLLGTAGALAGALRGTDAPTALARRIPRALGHGIRTGLTASLFILAAGAAVVGLSVAIGGGQATDMISAYHTGVFGQAGITLVSLAYGVNAVVWAAAYLLGPGFALGTGSVVRLTEVTVGPLPTLPLLAGLPDGPMGATGALLLALPVLAGMAAGWLLTLRLTTSGRGNGSKVARGRSTAVPTPRPRPGEPPPRPGDQPATAEPSWPLVIGGGLLAGPAAGVVLGILCLFSGGPLGGGRLATIGPDPWQVGLVAAAVVGVSATLGAAACRTVGPRPTEPERPVVGRSGRRR